MHEFFPTRARNELKSKYNREEKYNWERLNKVKSRLTSYKPVFQTLSMPAILNNSLYDQAEQVMNEIRAEEMEKRNRKRKPIENNGVYRLFCKHLNSSFRKF